MNSFTTPSILYLVSECFHPPEHYLAGGLWVGPYVGLHCVRSLLVGAERPFRTSLRPESSDMLLMFVSSAAWIPGNDKRAQGRCLVFHTIISRVH